MDKKNNKLWMETDEMAKRRIEQAKRLRAKASKGGLKFEAYLTPRETYHAETRVVGRFGGPTRA